jgi:hypothetical protein
MRKLLRRIIVWALGGEPVIRGAEPTYDPATLDKIAARLR